MTTAEMLTHSRTAKGIAERFAKMKEAETKKRAPYRGGKTTEALKPWLSEDPPMSRRTWYRHQAKKKSANLCK